MNEHSDTSGRKRKRGTKHSNGGTGSNDNPSRPSPHVEVLPLSNALKLISHQDDKKQHSDKRRVRIVHPYPYTFATFAKARWIGRTVLDVYVSEFGECAASHLSSANDHIFKRLITITQLRNNTLKRQLSAKLLRICH
jgi:hypothetical protein